VAIEIIKDRAPKARRIPSRSWRELIKKVWEVDPLLCPQCHHEMRIVSLSNGAQIIERTLRHVGSRGLNRGWMRFAITAFASRQARGRRQRKQSTAANSSSSHCLTI
jgi:hypothetical protein